MNALPQKISVVDDDDAVRDSLCLLLESHGVAVDTYGSARAFLDQSGDDDSGCLLLDLHMPEMNGLELLDALREQGSALPVIVITGRGDLALSRLVLQAGAYVLLDKPVESELLVQSIRDAVAAAPMAA